MTRTLQLTQLCYTSMPRAVTGVGGWQTFARTPGFDKVRVVEEHCQYERPRFPTTRTDEQMPIDYGYRLLDDEHACLYRICFAGADEFGRRGNYFVHTLVCKRADLDAIDGDALALLEWALRREVFFNHHTQVLERFPDKKFDLEPLTVEAAELLGWRREQEERPLVDWLQPYAAELREKAASDALRTALAPADQRRPVVWVGPENGLDNSQQELGVLRFLFAALPYAWRRQATFSTYRKAYQNASARWVGTVVENPNTIGEEHRRYQFYAINGPHPTRSSELPPADGHPWINEILKVLDRPFGKSPIGRASRFANLFEPPAEAELFKKDGFLKRMELSERFKPEREDHVQELLKALPSARPGREKVLDWLHQTFEGVELKQQPWVKTQLADLVKAYHELAVRRNLPCLAEDKRQKATLAFFGQLLDAALDSRQPRVLTPILGELRGNKALSFLRNDFRVRLVHLCNQLVDAPSALLLSKVNALLESYFGKAPASDPERQQFEVRLRRSLWESAGAINPDLAQHAATLLLPLFSRHQPENADELQAGLNLFACVRNAGGPDLVADYLQAACTNLGDPDPQLRPALIDSHRCLLLQYRPEWEKIAPELSEKWRLLLEQMTGSRLWGAFWQPEPSVQQGRYFGQLLTVLGDSKEARELARFAGDYSGVGVTVFDERLARLRAPEQTGTTRQYHAYARVLNIVAEYRSSATVTVQQHLLKLLALMYRDTCDTGTDPLYEAGAVLVRCLPSADRRWDFYLELAREVFAVLAVPGQPAREAPKLDPWYQVFSRLTRERDRAEGRFACCCLAVARRLKGGERTSEIQALAVKELLGNPDVIKLDATGPFSRLFQEQLRRTEGAELKQYGECISEKLRTTRLFRDWTEPALLGWWLLNWPCIADDRGNLLPGVSALPWVWLTRLLRGAATPEVQAPLLARLEKKVKDLLEKVENPREEAEKFPHHAWQELAYLLHVLPRSRPEVLGPLLTLVHRGLDETTDMRQLAQQLDGQTLVYLAPWYCERGKPEWFADLIRRSVPQPATLDFIHLLACTEVKDTTLGGELGLRVLRLRTKLAGWLWDPHEPAALAEYLGRAGDWLGAEGPTASPASCEATAFVLATHLYYHKEQYEQRLRWLLKSGAWEHVFQVRELGQKPNRKRFEQALHACLRGQTIDSDWVVKELK